MSCNAILQARQCAPAAILGTALALGFAQGAWAEEDEEFSMADIPSEYTAVESRFEFGTLYHNDDSYRFGDYTGLDEQQFYFLGNMDLRGRGAYDSPSARYWRLRSDSLGQESRRIIGEVGDQGLWTLELGFHQLPKLRQDQTTWFFGGDGDSLIVLPPGFDTSDPGQDQPAEVLANNPGLAFRVFEEDLERQRYWASGGVRLSEELWFRGRFDRETKDGTHLVGAVVAAGGGSPSSVTVPEPVDWETRRVDAGFDYATEQAQFKLGYNGSWFNNRKDSFSWQNPFTDPGWDSVPAEPTKGLPPDNRFDQFNFAGGYNLGDTTRVTLNGSWGRMRQDETFLNYTTNPVLAAALFEGLPESSADAEIRTTFAKLGFVTRPLPKLTLKAAWRYDDRDNKTPRRMFNYVVSDAGAQQDPMMANDGQRLNLPMSRRENEFSAGLSYQLARRTDVLFDYRHQEIDRTYTEVKTTRDDRYKLALNTRPLSWLSARAHVATSERDGTRYQDNRTFLQSHNPAYTATLTEPFENNPLLRRFYLADRERREGSASVSLMPMETVSIDLRADVAVEDYDHTEIGLTDRDTEAYTIDISFAPTDAISTYAFYTREESEIEQDGHDFRGFAVVADLADLTRKWTYEEQDDNDTVGFGLDLQVIPDKLSLNFEYLYSKGVVDINTRSAVITPFPNDLDTKLQNFRVGGEYQLNERAAVSMAYLFEKFDWDDWGYDGVAPATTNQVFNTGEGTPDDRSSLFLFSVRYAFE